MMNDPYTTPSQQPAPGQIPVLEPKSIKVFGVLHLVFGGIGVLGLIWGVANLFLGDALLKFQSGGDEDLYQMQKGMQDELLLPTMIALVLSVVVTFLILRAGLQLLKTKKTAVKASSAYSLASIGAKVIGLILAVTYTIPALNRYFDNLTEQMGGAGGSSMASTMEIMKATTSASGVISPIVACTYPVLCFFLLKKKNVSDFLEQHGK